MASVEESLVALAAATSPITALLGSSPLRLYPLRKPQGTTLPVGAYQRISTPERYMSHQGRSHLAVARFQLTFWTTSYSTSKALSDAFLGLLGYSGVMAGLRIGAILPAGEHDEFDATTQEYMRYIDLFITHEET